MTHYDATDAAAGRATATVGRRFDSSEIGDALTEMAVSGTAVVIGSRRPV
jgi:uncharacterized protein YbjQ (UPF0145 family)